MRLAEATTHPELTHHSPAQGPCTPLPPPPAWALLPLHLHCHGANQPLLAGAFTSSFHGQSRVLSCRKLTQEKKKKKISSARRLQTLTACLEVRSLLPKAASLTPAQPSHTTSPSAAHCASSRDSRGGMGIGTDVAQQRHS